MNRTNKHKDGLGVRAVSPVIANVLMAAAVVAMGLAVLFWATGTFGARQSEAGTFFSTSSEALKENLVIEDILFYEGSPKHVNVTVRNVGTVKMEVVSIYVDGEEAWNGSQGIEDGEAATIKVDFPWDVGEHCIVVETARENQVGEWYNAVGQEED